MGLCEFQRLIGMFLFFMLFNGIIYNFADAYTNTEFRIFFSIVDKKYWKQCSLKCHEVVEQN